MYTNSTNAPITNANLYQYDQMVPEFNYGKPLFIIALSLVAGFFVYHYYNKIKFEKYKNYEKHDD